MSSDSNIPGARTRSETFFGPHRLGVHLAAAFSVVVIGVGSALGVFHVLELREQRVEAAERNFLTASDAIVTRTNDFFVAAELAVEIIRRSPVMGATTMLDRLGYRRSLARKLDDNPNLASVFVGYPDGDFILMRRLETDEQRVLFDAPDGSAYLAQIVDREPSEAAVGAFFFYNEKLRVVEKRAEPNYASYDPRSRPWFQLAYRSTGVTSTPPYIFFTTRQVGATAAFGNRGEAVAGADVAFSALSSWLSSIRPVNQIEIGLFDGEGRLLAHSDPGKLIATDPEQLNRLRFTTLESDSNQILAKTLAAAGPGEGAVKDAVIDGERYTGFVRTLTVRGERAYTLIMAAPNKELFADAGAAAKRIAAIVAFILAAGIVIALLLTRHIAKPLERLAANASRIRQFDFGPSEPAPSQISEIEDLSDAFDGMKDTIRKFLDISAAIASEQKPAALMRKLLAEIVATTKTEGAVLYLASRDERVLTAEAAHIRQVGPVKAPEPSLSLDSEDGTISKAVRDRRSQRITVIENLLGSKGLDTLAAQMPSPPSEALAIPLFVGRDLIGALVLLEDGPLEPALVNFTEALAGSAAVSLQARRLLAAQRELFESLLRLVARAIDAKSPYTGGHCARVPVITKMIAAAAEAADAGPFADFSLTTDEWDAVHIAAWLHDCGKVTTPEFVVDKATKLETIYDRIHEVRMRVEVMKRDAEIAYLKATIDAGAEPIDARAKLDAEIKALDEDFAFLAAANTGDAPMSDEDIRRIRAIGEREWTRTLDDRLGLSHVELARKDRTPADALPAKEKLLADKVEHVFERPDSEKIPDDNPWGFNIRVPELLYNRGEIHNLSVRRGTLTDEDRYKINEHIVETIKMLEELPFPARIANVPELAGGHHERMDGRGYPRGLTGDQMSPVARMMAVADVFEALTAIDRPYKKGKTLSEALIIMAGMAAGGHLDQDIFELFLESKLYRDYARDYLNPEQIDDDAFDVEPLLKKAAE